MKRGYLLLVWSLAALFFAVVGVWLFNLATYNFWLANQSVPERLVYEHRLYAFASALVLVTGAMIYSLWQFMRTLL